LCYECGFAFCHKDYEIHCEGCNDCKYDSKEVANSDEDVLQDCVQCDAKYNPELLDPNQSCRRCKKDVPTNPSFL
jgi:hypothetical protein